MTHWIEIFRLFFLLFERIERKRTLNAEEKQKDQREGEEYRRLAEQYALEHMELDRFRKLTQKDVRHMYDKAVEDRNRVKEMEKQMDEVMKKRFSYNSCISDL